jgi:hypothetical protein
MSRCSNIMQMLEDFALEYHGQEGAAEALISFLAGECEHFYPDTSADDLVCALCGDTRRAS